jgi:uncharacterized secreted protein with C-terminal beta-propeller domain
MVVAIAPLYFETPTVSGQVQLKRFSSYEELKSFLNTSSQRVDYYYGGSRRNFGFTLAAMESGAKSIPDYSTTNIQVEGVDEADVVKTDGEYIYLISENSVVILKAYPPEEARVLSRTELNGTLRGIFVNGDKMVVFGDEGIYYGYYERFISYETPRTFAKVYDVSDRENPVLKRNLFLDGYYYESRMVSDYVYVVINQPVNYDMEVVLPKIYSDNEVEEINASQIYYSNISDCFNTFTTIVSINVQNDTEEPTHETILLGSASTVYASLSNIYVTFLDWNGGQRSSIHRIHIDNRKIEYVASGEVPGYVLNQFSIDEYEGYLRVATTTGQVWSSKAPSRNNVYVLDLDLHIVGWLENLAPGETIYSARFMGVKCYLVTFKKVDPLFVIDMKDPFAPQVLGYLKITGYSDYLHPYDENHIIGIGKETVAAEEGDFAWYQGVKISLFDVTDVTEPKEIAKYEIGDRGTDSPVLRDHKAFLFDRSKNLLVIPVLVAEIDQEEYPGEIPPFTRGDYVWQGAYVFNISLGGLAFRGGITHIESDTEPIISVSPYHVKRSLYIDNVLYTISDKKTKMNSLEDLDEINEVELS